MEMKVIVILKKSFVKEVYLFWGKVIIVRNVNMKRNEVLVETSKEANF